MKSKNSRVNSPNLHNFFSKGARRRGLIGLKNRIKFDRMKLGSVYSLSANYPTAIYQTADRTPEIGFL